MQRGVRAIVRQQGYVEVGAVLAVDQSSRGRRGRRPGLALVNHHPFAIENANMRLVHRDIEASEIVHIGSPLPYPGQSYRPSQKSSRPLPHVEEPLFWRQRLGFVALSARQIVNRRRTLPPDRRPKLTPMGKVWTAALAAAELVGFTQPGRARVSEVLFLERQARFLKRQLSLPVSTMSQ